jgi:RNA polymerase sigma factor (sigma-70 family)
VRALGDTTDAELVGRCRADEGAAWDELVTRYTRYVRVIATRAFGLSESDADDVRQEVFARAYAQLGGLRDDAALRPWLAQTTRRLSIDRLRAADREIVTGHPRVDGPADAGDGMGPLDDLLSVQAAMERLAPECREVLERFFGRDESYRSIAAALELPIGTIASRISRCLGRLRSELRVGVVEALR